MLLQSFTYDPTFIIILELTSFIFSYLIFSIAEKELPRVKSFKHIPFNLLFAVFLPFCYLLFTFPDQVNIYSRSMVIAGPSGYNYSWNYVSTEGFQYVIAMLSVALREGLLQAILFFHWPLGFLLCYLIFSILEAVYGMLIKPKKTLSK
jgi:hypothetical protein